MSSASAEKIVGKRIRVWWAGDGSWYSGVVKKYDPAAKKQHYIVYEDGERKWHSLFHAGEIWEELACQPMPVHGLCSALGCILEDRHAGLHIFPEPTKRSRSQPQPLTPAPAAKVPKTKPAVAEKATLAEAGSLKSPPDQSIKSTSAPAPPITKAKKTARPKGASVTASAPAASAPEASATAARSASAAVSTVQASSGKAKTKVSDEIADFNYATAAPSAVAVAAAHGTKRAAPSISVGKTDKSSDEDELLAAPTLPTVVAAPISVLDISLPVVSELVHFADTPLAPLPPSSAAHASSARSSAAARKAARARPSTTTPPSTAKQSSTTKPLSTVKPPSTAKPLSTAQFTTEGRWRSVLTKRGRARGVRAEQTEGLIAAAIADGTLVPFPSADETAAGSEDGTDHGGGEGSGEGSGGVGGDAAGGDAAGGDAAGGDAVSTADGPTAELIAELAEFVRSHALSQSAVARTPGLPSLCDAATIDAVPYPLLVRVTRARLAKSGISQSQLAPMLRLSNGMLSNWLNDSFVGHQSTIEANRDAIGQKVRAWLKTPLAVKPKKAGRPLMVPPPPRPFLAGEEVDLTGEDCPASAAAAWPRAVAGRPYSEPQFFASASLAAELRSRLARRAAEEEATLLALVARTREGVCQVARGSAPAATKCVPFSIPLSRIARANAFCNPKFGCSSERRLVSAAHVCCVFRTAEE